MLANGHFRSVIVRSNRFDCAIPNNFSDNRNDKSPHEPFLALPRVDCRLTLEDYRDKEIVKRHLSCVCINFFHIIKPGISFLQTIKNIIGWRVNAEKKFLR